MGDVILLVEVIDMFVVVEYDVVLIGGFFVLLVVLSCYWGSFSFWFVGYGKVFWDDFGEIYCGDLDIYCMG